MKNETKTLLFTNIGHSKPILVITIFFINVFIDAFIGLIREFGIFAENLVNKKDRKTASLIPLGLVFLAECFKVETLCLFPPCL